MRVAETKRERRTSRMRMPERYRSRELGDALVQAMDDLVGVTVGADGYVGDGKEANEVLLNAECQARLTLEEGAFWDVWPEGDSWVGNWGGSIENMVWKIESGGEAVYVLGDTDHNPRMRVLTKGQAIEFLERAAEIVEETAFDEEVHA